MRKVKFSLIDLLFPLALLGFIGPVVKYSNLLFTTSTRWALIAILMIYLVLNRKLFVGLKNGFGLALVLYSSWSMTTYFWSQADELSLYKSGALILVSLTLVSAGAAWSRIKKPEFNFDYLYPIVFLGLLAGVLGRGTASAVVSTGNLDLYQGLTGNPNMLGSLIAMGMPLILWRLYWVWGIPKKKWFWLSLAGIDIILLLFANSRAAMLVIIIMVAGLMLSLGLRKQLGYLIIGASALLVTMFVFPDLQGIVSDRYIYKSTSPELGVFYTREEPWRISYKAAVEGGLLGLGYGVSSGGGEFGGGLTAVGYGREKGNTQMAIVEETGLVGLALYAWLVISLFSIVIKAYRRAVDQSEKALMGLLLGALAGSMVQSIFEAWWVAPGSPESAAFWALAGVSLGAAERVHYKYRQRLLQSKANRDATTWQRITKPAREGY